jgi:hypothetical protein
MKVDGLPDVDFTSCDACRQPFSETCAPTAFGIEPDGAPELIVGLCSKCMAAFAGADPAKAAAVSGKAEATARLRPGRLRTPA